MIASVITIPLRVSFEKQEQHRKTGGESDTAQKWQTEKVDVTFQQILQQAIPQMAEQH